MKPSELADTFTKVVESLKHIVIVVAQIDPDALASAFVLKEIISKISAKSTMTVVDIVFGGHIGNAQNRTIINLFDLSRAMIPSTEYDFSKCEAVALVDSSKMKDGRVTLPTNLSPVIVIDHHRDSDLPTGGGQFYWIDEVGSCSTMLVELWLALGFGIEKLNEALLVMLALGVFTDTQALIQAGERDFQVYQSISKRIEPRQLQKFLSPALNRDYFDQLQIALQNRVQKNGSLVTGLGTIDHDDGDNVALIADLLIRESTVSTVIVWAIVDNVIRIAARNDDVSEPLEDFLREKFGPDSGAKLTSHGLGIGGARLELNSAPWMTKALKYSDSQKKLEDFIGQLVQDLVFND
ncbi:MAG: DHH family phosphoesterase [bacterium]